MRYQHGQTAVMTVYENSGVVRETIALHTLQSKQAMHALMKEKGFVLKTAIQKQHSPAPTAPVEQVSVRSQAKVTQPMDVAVTAHPAQESELDVKNRKEQRMIKREETLGKAREEREKIGHATLPQSSPPY